MSTACDDIATTVYLREPPLPVHPPHLAPEPPREPHCGTCPFRQEAPITLVLPDDLQPGPAPARPRRAPVPPVPAPQPPPPRARPALVTAEPALPLPRHAPVLPRPAARPPDPVTTHAAPTLGSPEPAAPFATLTEFRPAAAPAGSTTEVRPVASSAAPTVVQQVSPPRRGLPSLRPRLALIQLGLWVVIAGGLLFLAFRSPPPPSSSPSAGR